MCDGTGEAAVAVFRIADGKITLWHQLPPVEHGNASRLIDAFEPA